MHQLELIKLKMTAVAMLALQGGDLARLAMMLHGATLREKNLLTKYYEAYVKHCISQQARVG